MSTATVPGAVVAAQALAVGAEARLTHDRFLGRAVVRKDRLRKGYRDAGLDARLRTQRTREEAHLLVQARAAGVPVPVVYDVDGNALVLEHIAGPTLKEQLALDDDRVAAGRLRQLGMLAGRLHLAGLTHGDLTTSNVLVHPEPPDGAAPGMVLIDFGLGGAGQAAEAKGVDLHLIEEALAATDARAAPLFAAFLAGYREASGPGSDEALRRLDEIRERGRYR